MSVEQVVDMFRGRFADDAIFLRPAIPPAKLQGAISTYAPHVQPHEVMLLVDNTVFGSAGDGMIVTPTQFCGHDMGGVPICHSMDRVQQVDIVLGFLSKKIVVDGGQHLVTLNIPGNPGCMVLVQFMREALARYRAAGTAAPQVAAAAVPGACHACGAPWGAGARFCQYCGSPRSA